MRASNQVILASQNRHKLAEFQAIFRKFLDIDLSLAGDYIRNAEKLSLVENFNTYSENATAKAQLANNAAHYPSLGDDSGLEVMALEGRPGVRSHRYAIPKAGVSQEQANIEKLLQELGGQTGEKRAARFVTSLSLVIEGLTLVAEGSLQGQITEAPRGSHGFGYDSVFVPNGNSKTLAEMSADEKNSISHRFLAVKNLVDQISKQGVLFAKP